MAKHASSVHAKHNVDAESIIFSMFTNDDLKKICITKICTALAFDALGYPLPGGLYDKTLGPLNTKSDPCSTCNKTVTNCPGHFGYIELPLPVVNPIFHKMLITILNLSCLQCFRMQIPDILKRTLHDQIKLLDYGMVTEAIEMERIVNAILADSKDEEVYLEESTSKRLHKLEQLAKSLKNTGAKVVNKTTESLRNNIIHNILHAFRMRKKCMHCKAAFIKLQTFKNKIMTHIASKDEIELCKNKKNKQLFLKSADIKILAPDETRQFLRNIWANDKELILEIVPVLKGLKCEYPTDVFYFDIIPVPPPNARPINFVDNMMVLHPQSQVYKAILQDSMLIRAVIQIVQGSEIDDLPAERRAVYQSAQGATAIEKLHHLWQQLQATVDSLMDAKLGIKTDGQGLKQIIEKKAGIIRMHMMGKRVNFAARSVITPDPNLNIDEIGIPEEFAKQLTYPVPVTSWNVEELRKMVLNGPDVHPGAKMVEFGDGNVFKINGVKSQQESILKRLLTPVAGEKDAFKGVKIVHRHLCNGDILLLNRQPTLHKPSIMSHTARILKGEKTIRLHYANCKAYNADFDGDEMNVHFPQNELARSEGYNLSNVCNQYLVPKDGTPLSGLIQDHMVSGVRLSMRGRFFKRHDYHQLVYQALAHKTGNIILLKPTILKPEVLWSGKQVLSTVIINIIPPNRKLINLTATAKISVKNWVNGTPRPWKAGGPQLKDNNMSEAEVVIRQGELLVGVLDKTHYGATPYGLIHCMYELYGAQYAAKLLSSFAKLFTCFLQQEGFTLGVHDILVLDHADKSRTDIIKECRKVGHIASCKAVDMPVETPEDVLLQKLEQAHASNPKFRTIIDRQYKQELDSYTNDINKVCLPAGLLCKFPENNLQLMVQSGAKGSTVNTMQISCLLGQIELEGKRPPVMISGKSLPSFIPFDVQPRAGGFIDGRFMTGILPQEFFFHCMAGREGLIDTAVKTSRSGYLQRCLVKHLEGLKVGYDLTVRDSDQSVIQFFYGEDGMDISKVQFLKESQLSFLDENSGAIINEQLLTQLKDVEGYDRLEKRVKATRKALRKSTVLKKGRNGAFLQFSKSVHDNIHGDMQKINSKTGRTEKTRMIIDLWQKSTPEIQKPFKRNITKIADPTPSDFQPDHYFGSLTDNMETLLAKYITKSKQSDSKAQNFTDTLRLKAMQSLCCPGEPVGLLAAQSIGEPSTQMTLNTFHFAGRGEMNVTLGIPRLREILMMASSRIKTPSMEVPFLKVDNLEKRAEMLRKSLTRVTIANVLEKIDVRVKLQTSPVRQHYHTVRFQFLPYALYKTEFNVTPKTILKHMSTKFFVQMFSAIRKVAKISASSKMINETEETKTSDKEAVIEDGSSDEEPEDADEDAKLQSRFKGKEDQEPSDDEVEVSDVDDDDKEEEEEVAMDTTVVDSNVYAEEYIYDKKHHLWCQLSFCLPMTLKNVDLTAVLKDVAGSSVVYETDQIKRAITYTKDDVELMLRTDGINIPELVKNYDLLDVNRLYSNDIHKIAHTYGIEAARRVIVKEVKDVFNVYGITVDPRHLLLIADYMTYNGSFEPLSRKGMECNSSPLQQMSFESSLTFLKSASIQGKKDYLTSPSSCLMLGKPCTTGTGSFSLLQSLPVFV